MSMLEEFKKFAMKGNMIDLAVGFILGGAFGQMVSSLVNDVVMPPIGMLLQGVDFSKLGWMLQSGDEPVMIAYGAFLNTVINFVIVALAVFFMVKAVNKMMNKKDDPTTKACPACKMDIPVDASKCGHCTSSI